MILPKQRDPRFITVRRGGTLQDADHHLLAIWAADCAQHVLHLFEEMQPNDERPRRAIDSARAWAQGEITMSQSKAAGGHAMAAARNLSGASRQGMAGIGKAKKCVTNPPAPSFGHLPLEGKTADWEVFSFEFFFLIPGRFHGLPSASLREGLVG